MNNNKQIITSEQVVSLQNKVNNAKSVVFKALEPQELLNPIITLVEVNNAIKTAKAKLKEVNAPILENIKVMEQQAETLEVDIKKSFLDNYKVETHLKVRANKDGEVVGVKEVETDNKGKGLFTHTPASSKLELDYSKITYENFPEFYELKPVLNKEKVKEYITNHSIPQEWLTKVDKPATVGIQWKNVEEQIKSLGDKNEKR